MKIQKKNFTKLYYQLSALKLAEHFGISQTKVYKLVNQFGIKKKSSLSSLERWFIKAEVPDSLEEYHKKWKGYKPLPIDKWFTSESKEAKYLARKKPLE